MKLNKPILIKCNECDEIIEVETDIECVSSYEREMGTEREYESILDENCPKCGNCIYIKLSTWEYPEGAINNCEEVIEGAEILEEPDYNLFDYD